MQHIPVTIQSKEDDKKGPAYPDLVGKAILKPGNIRVCILEGGMKSGATSVMILVETSAGLVSVEMSANMLDTINGAVKGAVQRFGK